MSNCCWGLRLTRTPRPLSCIRHAGQQDRAELDTPAQKPQQPFMLLCTALAACTSLLTASMLHGAVLHGRAARIRLQLPVLHAPAHAGQQGGLQPGTMYTCLQQWYTAAVFNRPHSLTCSETPWARIRPSWSCSSVLHMSSSWCADPVVCSGVVLVLAGGLWTSSM